MEGGKAGVLSSLFSLFETVSRSLALSLCLSLPLCARLAVDTVAQRRRCVDTPLVRHSDQSRALLNFALYTFFLFALRDVHSVLIRNFSGVASHFTPLSASHFAVRTSHSNITHDRNIHVYPDH